MQLDPSTRIPDIDDVDFWDPRVFLPCHWIKGKGTGYLQFRLFPHQAILSVAVLQAYRENRWIAHLKPRQTGSTTFFTGVIYQHTAFRAGCTSAVLAHKEKTSQSAARIAMDLHRYAPPELKQVKSPHLKRRLEFPAFGSQMTIETVKGDEPLRGETTHALLATEVCAWGTVRAEDAWVSARNSVPSEGGFLVVDSTPMHAGDEMHKVWQEAQATDSKWIGVFVPWTMISEYEMEPPKGWIPHSDVRDYADRYHLRHRQAYWMQREGLPKCKGSIERFMAEYPENDRDCWRRAGNPVFPVEVLDVIEKSLPPKEQFLRTAQDYQEFQAPQRTRPDGTAGPRQYIVVVDPATSDAKRDYVAIQVMDLETCAFVAEFHGHERTHLVAIRVMQLAMRYNKAEVYVEANGPGEAILSHLEACGYHNVFYRVDGFVGRGTAKAGWWSSAARKREAIDDLIELVMDGSLTIYSRRLLDMLYEYRGSWEAGDRDAQGGHFDLVAAAAIAAWAWKRSAAAVRLRRFGSREAVSQEDVWRWVEEQARYATALPDGRGMQTPWGTHR